MGDAVLSTATLNELKRLEPNCEIHYLVPQAWAALFESHPNIDKVWIDRTAKNFLKRFWSRVVLLWHLRRMKFDVAIALHASRSSSRLIRMVGAQLRVVHNHNFFRPDWFSQRVIPRKNELAHFVERDLKSLESMGMIVNRNASTSLFLKKNENEWASQKLFNELAFKRPLLIICLGASRPTKIWPINNFSQVSKWWIEKQEGAVVALCSNNETFLATELNSNEFLKTSPMFKIMNHLSLRQMMSILAQADVVLGNDSGPRHVAAALGRPTLTLYGPQDPYECHPYLETKHPYLFVPDLHCRSNVDPSGKHFWCGLHECYVEKHRCMKEISVEQVKDRLMIMRVLN